MEEEIRLLLDKERYDIDDLLEIMRILRSEGGCPWDREQTHRSIRNNFIEETYEVVEAIDNDDRALLREELGDVLLQVVFHSRMCEEEGAFDFSDVADEICRKLIIRHPHIFGDTVVDSVGDVITNWESIKQKTKSRLTTAEALEGISKALPSLIRAGKISKKAAKENCQINDVLAEVPEDGLAEYVGKLLFDISASAEMHGLNAEQALYDYCEKFIGGFGK